MQKPLMPTLVLHYTERTLGITVTDNGVGFEMPGEVNTVKNNKAGLKNMETRTRMIQGEMQIQSKANQGSVLSFNIPF